MSIGFQINETRKKSDFRPRESDFSWFSVFFWYNERDGGDFGFDRRNP